MEGAEHPHTSLSAFHSNRNETGVIIFFSKCDVTVVVRVMYISKHKALRDIRMRTH